MKFSWFFVAPFNRNHKRPTFIFIHCLIFSHVWYTANNRMNPMSNSFTFKRKIGNRVLHKATLLHRVHSEVTAKLKRWVALGGFQTIEQVPVWRHYIFALKKASQYFHKLCAKSNLRPINKSVFPTLESSDVCAHELLERSSQYIRDCILCDASHYILWPF